MKFIFQKDSLDFGEKIVFPTFEQKFVIDEYGFFRNEYHSLISPDNFENSYLYGLYENNNIPLFPTWNFSFPTKSSPKEIDLDVVFSHQLYNYERYFLNVNFDYKLEDFFFDSDLQELYKINISYSPLLFSYYSFDEINNMLSDGSLFRHSSGLILTSSLYYKALPDSWRDLLTTDGLTSFALGYPLDDPFRKRYEAYITNKKIVDIQYQFNSFFSYFPNIDKSKFNFYLKDTYYPFFDYDNNTLGYFKTDFFEIFIKFDSFFEDLGNYERFDLKPLFDSRVLSTIFIGNLYSPRTYPPLYITQYYEGEVLEMLNPEEGNYYIYYQGDTETLVLTPEGFFYMFPVNNSDKTGICKLFGLFVDLPNYLQTIAKDRNILSGISNTPNEDEEEKPFRCCLAECFGITE